jgi:hypothetical protein
MVEANGSEGGAHEAEPDFKPKRSKVGLALALVAVLAGVAGGAFLLLQPKEAPLRVLVAVEADGHWWDGSTTAARLLDNVVPYLERLGFDPIDGGDLEVVKALEGAATPEEAAERLGARFVVTGPLRVEITDLGAKIGVTEVRGSGTIHLAAVGGARRAVGEIRTWAGAPHKDAALAFVSESLGFQTFDVLLPALMQHENVVQIRTGSDRIAAGKLSAAEVYLEKRKSQLGFADNAYAELERQFKATDRSPSKVTLHGPLRRQDGLCSVAPDGLFVRSNAIRPFYSPKTEVLQFFLELEKLEHVDHGGKTRVLFEGYNMLGYPSASDDGKVAAYVEDLYGAGTALSVAQGTAPPKRVPGDEKLRRSEPKLAPDGSLVASWTRPCPACPPFVAVQDLAGKELYRSDPAHGTLGGFVWLAPRRLGVLLRGVREVAPALGHPVTKTGSEGPAGAESQTFSAVDLSVSPPVVNLLGSVSSDSKLALPSVDADGGRVVFSRYADDGMHLALYDAARSTLEPLAVESAFDPALSPAGDVVAFVRAGDVFVYDIAGKKPLPLTNTGNAFELRYPLFARDGKRVYFEVRVKDPVFPKERSISTIGSVPVPVPIP